MTKLHKLDYESPIGVIEIIGSDDAIISILFSEQGEKVNFLQNDTPQVLVDCFRQLDEYYKGIRYEFTIPYRFEGTEFQKNVWKALTSIPTGKQDFIRI
jgi:methylated-DNA-[protein]-cysteine S-methyltransferase